jgi:Ca2+-binding RTX toxin-like protein
MTTIALSQSLFESDLSGLLTPATIKNNITNIISDLQGDVTFNEEQPENGTIKNPTFTGAAGEYKTNGSVIYKTNAAGDVSGASSFKGATITTDSGIINLVGAFSNSSSFDGNYSLSQKVTNFSYVGEDGSKWSIVGGYNWNYKYTASNEKSSYSYSQSFQSFSSTDSNKNSISFTGNLSAKWNSPDDTPAITGFITAISLNVAGSKLNVTGLKLSYDDMLSFELGNINDLLPNFLMGNDVLTVSATDSVYEINGYAGNDKITGSTEDDTIIGGAGSDKMTGGKGAYTYLFSKDDFLTENSKGDLIFNKSVDVVSDFNLKDHDTLDFTDLGVLSFYATLSAAKNDNADLFYVKGSGKVYLNTDTTGDKYTPTVIITLTGNPAVNPEGTDFNYPV